MKKKILLIVSTIKKGGTQKIILDLYNFWKSKGYIVKIITFDNKINDKDIKKNLIQLNLQKKSTNKFQAILNNFKRIYKLRNNIKKNQYNHIFSFISTTNILAIIANIGIKNKLIISERNDPELQSIGITWVILRKIFYRYADKVTANSKNACNYLKKFVPTKKIFFIPNHIFFKKNKKLIKKEKYILAIGRLHYQKGFDTLIDSFNLSEIYKIGWKLIILGEGPDKKILKKKVKELNLDNNVLFKGFTNPTPWYNKSKIFILSSRYEGTPNVLLEAVSMNLPTIITSSCYGAKYYLKNNISTLEAPANNSVKLSKLILKLVNDNSLQRKLSTKAYIKVKKLANYKRIFRMWDFFLK